MVAFAAAERPGRARPSSTGPDSVSTTPSPRANAHGGRVRPHPSQRQPSGAKVSRAPHQGQADASSSHANPAATHTVGISPAAKATRGSSALATTTRGRWAANAARQRSAVARTSCIRSSWSRDRLSSTTTSGATISSAHGTTASSTSRAASDASGERSRAPAIPLARFEPVWLVAVGARVASPSATRRVVVVLPLVPDTSTTRIGRASVAATRGAMRRATRPPMTVPSPRPAHWDTLDTARPATRAARTRRPGPAAACGEAVGAGVGSAITSGRNGTRPAARPERRPARHPTTDPATDGVPTRPRSRGRAPAPRGRSVTWAA